MRVGHVRRRFLLLSLVVAGLVAAPPADAALSLSPDFTGGTVPAPMYVTAPAGDTHDLFIVTRSGYIRLAIDDVLQSTPFLDIHNDVYTKGEGALGSMAFDPGYSDPQSAGYGLFYIYYAKKPASGNGPIHIEEFKVTDPTQSPPTVDMSSRRVVLEIPHPDASNHYGGTLQFGPVDHLLYIGTGDGGGSNNQFGNAQDTKKSLLGKLLRIDPHKTQTAPYSIPTTNPFNANKALCNPPSGAADCPEILAWGLRNPFRWSFDSSNGDLTIGDVGQDAYEEIDYVPVATSLAKANFGWPCREGTLVGPGDPGGVTPDPACPVSPRIDPVDGYSHTGLSGPIAITGGLVVRDPSLPTLDGRYLWADFYKGQIHSAALTTPTVSDDRIETDLPSVPQLVSFGTDGQNRVYVVSLAGSVQRLCPDSCGAAVPPPPPAPEPPAPAPDPTPLPGPAPDPTQAPPPPIAVADRTAPHLRIRVAHRQDVLRFRTVRLAVSCDKSCLVRATARARGFKLRGSLRRLAAGRSSVFTLRVSARALHALARRGTVTVTVRARDAAGNLRTASLLVSVRR